MVTNKTGSILIWSIFLVIAITSSFLYISLQITKSLDKNKSVTEKTHQMVTLDNAEPGVMKKYSIGDNEYLEYAYFNSYENTLSQNETVHFGFNQNNTGSIIIKSGGPVYYKVYNTLSTLSQGVLTGGLDDIELRDNLIIQNLGGMAQISVEFTSSSGVVFDNNYYKRVKNIGGSEIILSTTEVK